MVTNIFEKVAILYGNYDGHAGKEGDYTEYHHVGFDVVANRILESVLRYDIILFEKITNM